MQEVQRLQQTVQEKSKALKVVELELARYKAKESKAPVSAKAPGAKPAAPPAAVLEEEEQEDQATRLNLAMPPEGGGDEPETTQPAIPVKRALLSGPAPATAGRAGALRSPVAASPAAPKKAVPAPLPADERTLVGQPLSEGKEDDWTSLVDELDK